MTTIRTRRPPQPFRVATVVAVTELAPAFVRLHLAADALVGFEQAAPSASLRLLVPRPDVRDADGGEILEIPAWLGNEFRYADGTRPPLRVYTPLHVDPDAGTMDIDVYLHEHGTVARWVRAGCVGKELAVSGPGRGYPLPDDRSDVLLVGDATAQPAMAQLLQQAVDEAAAEPAGDTAGAGPARTVRIRCEAVPDARVLDAVVASDQVTTSPLAARIDLQWFAPREGAAPGTAVIDAVLTEAIDEGTYVWAAGEAASMQRLRHHLFRDLGLPRTSSVVRGYWKVGQSGDTGD